MAAGDSAVGCRRQRSHGVPSSIAQTAEPRAGEEEGDDRVHEAVVRRRSNSEAPFCPGSISTRVVSGRGAGRGASPRQARDAQKGRLSSHEASEAQNDERKGRERLYDRVSDMPRIASMRSLRPAEGGDKIQVEGLDVC